MAWVLIDDAFNDHPKWASAPCDSIAMWVAAIAWCNHNERWDGRIPTVRLSGLVNAKNPKRTIVDLEARQAIHRDGDHHVIHDFAEWQQVDRKKLISERRREAGRRGGLTTQAKQRGEQDASNCLSTRSTNSSSQPPTTNHQHVPISGNSTPENTPAAVDKSRIEAIADEYARLALGQAKLQGRAITDDDAYTRGAKAKAKKRAELATWMPMFPTAPASAVAAWLMGDKHSMAYYERADDLAEVIQLREESAS